MNLQQRLGNALWLVALAGGCSPKAELNLAPDPWLQSTQIVRLDRGVIQGRVRPIRSLGEPFRAVVRLTRGQSDSTVAMTSTDSKGAFRFPSLSGGTYRLAVLSIGYRRAAYTIVTADSGARDVLVGIMPDPFSLDEICAGTCPAQPTGVITGTITCARGARVVPPELALALTDSVTRQLRALGTVQATGHFEMSGIPLGAWRVEVSQRARSLSVFHVRLVRDTLKAGNVHLACR